MFMYMYQGKRNLAYVKYCAMHVLVKQANINVMSVVCLVVFRDGVSMANCVV